MRDGVENEVDLLSTTVRWQRTALLHLEPTPSGYFFCVFFRSHTISTSTEFIRLSLFQVKFLVWSHFVFIIQVVTALS